MATLCLADSGIPDPEHTVESIGMAPDLRAWLAGDWAILFSHPDDFHYRGLEYDRWLTILRDEFHACGARPVACALTAKLSDASWVSELTADWRRLALHDGKLDDPRPSDWSLQNTGSRDAVIDLAARVLRAEIAALPARFVLIVDATLRRRGVLRYSAAGTTVSPLDLLALVSALRRQPPMRRAA